MDALDSLMARLPPGAVTVHPGELAEHTHDRWALAMLREVRGERVPPGAAVVFPGSTEDVAATLAWAEEYGRTVVPRGGATGLAGGAQAIKRSIVVDTSRLDRVLDVDQISQVVRAQAGVRGAALEAALAPHGLTAGHDLASTETSTVGGWIAAASMGFASSGNGGIQDRLLGLTAVLSGGDVLRLKPAPRFGAGPDLRRLFVGSAGALGILTEATLTVSRSLAEPLWESFRPHSFEAGAGLVREAIQRGWRPLIVRLLDESEAATQFGAFGYPNAPLAVLGFDPAGPAVEAQRFELRALAREFGAAQAGPDLAKHWWDRRHDAVAWYEGVMGPERTLGEGVVVDSFDAAALWRRVPRLYEEVRGSLLEHAEEVGCRLVHAGVTGASMEFPFVLRAGDDAEAEGLYRQAWGGAVAACLDAGGTMADHHGLGLRSAEFLPEELGHTGAEVLQGIKSALDPSGLMNPGKLIARGGSDR